MSSWVTALVIAAVVAGAVFGTILWRRLPGAGYTAELRNPQVGRSAPTAYAKSGRSRNLPAGVASKRDDWESDWTEVPLILFAGMAAAAAYFAARTVLLSGLAVVAAASLGFVLAAVSKRHELLVHGGRGAWIWAVSLLSSASALACAVLINTPVLAPQRYERTIDALKERGSFSHFLEAEGVNGLIVLLYQILGLVGAVVLLGLTVATSTALFWHVSELYGGRFARRHVAMFWRFSQRTTLVVIAILALLMVVIASGAVYGIASP